MDEKEEMERKEAIDDCVDFIATVVSSYWKALLDKGVPPPVATSLVETLSGGYWERHVCMLHGDDEEE